MKLLILLFIISNVYCGITNNLTVLPGTDIYIAHTENSVIYKISTTTFGSTKEAIVGQEGFHGKEDKPDIINGANLVLYRPTSIINSLNNSIYFVNNNIYIKHFKTYDTLHKTQTINTAGITFNLITNITIDPSDNLYIANYYNLSDISTIYKFKKDNNMFVQEFRYLTQKTIVNEKIKAINYVNDKITVITNKNYYTYSSDLEDRTPETHKIESTNNTNKLKDIQDFVIDENFEIGYIAFQERLKWFYF